MSCISLRRHVCRLSLHLRAPKDSVWISDDVLESAVTHFSHSKTSRRHVSLAPGPLEARKRGAKRRMVNVAQVRGGDDIDPSLLQCFGQATERIAWQWQSPTPPLAETSAEPVRWPTGFDDFKASKTQLENEKEIQVYQNTQCKPIRVDPNFYIDLKSCRDLNDLRNWAATRGVDLQKYSRIAFRHLYDTNPPLATLLGALDDSALRTWGNLNFLLRRQLREPLILDAGLLGQWVKGQLTLGLWSKKEILNLIDIMSGTDGLSNDEQLKCNLVWSIFEGLQSSAVYGIHDVHTEIPIQLLRILSQGSFASESQELGSRVIKALPLLQLERMADSISSFVKKSLYAQAIFYTHAQKAMLQRQAMAKTLSVLPNLPSKVADSVIVSTSKALIYSGPDHLVRGRPLLKLLDLWWSMVAEVEALDFVQNNPLRTKIERLLGKKSSWKFLGEAHLHIIATYLRHLNDYDKARFIVRHLYEYDGPRFNGIMRHFDELLEDPVIKSPFVSMVRILQERGKPPRAKMALLFRLLQILHMSPTILEIIESSSSSYIRVSDSIVLIAIRTHMTDSPWIAQRIFYAYAQLPLEKCPDFAEKLIANPTIQPGVPLYYYKSRRPGRHERPRAHLLGRIALAYSRATHLTPRTALRKVFKCYQCHMKERLGPLPSSMVLALTEAGIIRPLQQNKWLGSVQLLWILSLVRAVEGNQIADQVDAWVYKWRGAVGRTQRRKRKARIKLSRLKAGIQRSKPKGQDTAQ